MSAGYLRVWCEWQSSAGFLWFGFRRWGAQLAMRSPFNGNDGAGCLDAGYCLDNWSVR